MINTHFKSKQNQFWHLDTETILSPPLYILLGSNICKEQKRNNLGGEVNFREFYCIPKNAVPDLTRLLLINYWSGEEAFLANKVEF